MQIHKQFAELEKRRQEAASRAEWELTMAQFDSEKEVGTLPFLVSFTALQCFSLPFLVVSPPSLGHAGGGPPARAR